MEVFGQCFLGLGTRGLRVPKLYVHTEYYEIVANNFPLIVVL